MAQKCKTCGKSFSAPKGKGRPAKHCESCRKPRGEERDPQGNRERFNARRRSTRAAASANSRDRVADANSAAELAAALSIFPDAASAAAFLGLDQVGDELDELEQTAREAHAGVVDGSPAELGRRMVAVLHLCATQFMRQRAFIAPRDLGHAARAFAQAYHLVGGAKQSRYANVQLYVTGADGKAFDPNAEAQPPIVSAEPTKH